MECRCDASQFGSICWVFTPSVDFFACIQSVQPCMCVDVIMKIYCPICEKGAGIPAICNACSFPLKYVYWFFSVHLHLSTYSTWLQHIAITAWMAGPKIPSIYHAQKTMHLLFLPVNPFFKQFYRIIVSYHISGWSGDHMYNFFPSRGRYK